MTPPKPFPHPHYLINLTVLTVSFLFAFTSCNKDNESPIIISEVKVTPETSEVAPGYSLQLTATVNGENLTEMEKTVTWSVTGGKSQTTTISADGTLAVADNETAESLTVKATSKIYDNKSGTATVSVIQQAVAEIIHSFHPDAELVEIQYMGKKIVCEKVDGRLLFQGDIIVNQDDINTRAAQYLGLPLWTYGKIFYTYNINTDTPYRTIVSDAMKEISASTNIKFIELKTPEALRFMDKNNKCYIELFKGVSDGASAGRSWNGMRFPAQELTIITITKGTVVHELGHAMGLMHEHARSDRHKYVMLVEDKIDRNQIGTNKTPQEIDALIQTNFKNTYEMGVHSEEFDYTSTMIYDPRATGKIENGVQQQVLVRADGTSYLDAYLLSLLRGGSFSPKDIEVLNKMYPNRNASPDVFIHETYNDRTSNSIKLTCELIYEGYPALTANSLYGIRYKPKLGGLFKQEFSDGLKYDRTYACTLKDLAPDTEYEAWAFVDNGTTTEGENKFSFKTLPGSTNRFTITASVSGGNGSISPSGTQQYNQGSDVTFTITPNSGYEINSLLVNNVNRTGEVSGGKYVLRNITTNYTINVSFKQVNISHNEYYQGPSGYVKFNYIHQFSDKYYIGIAGSYPDTTFVVKLGGDQFYLDKIDATRYLKKHGDKYMVPAIPPVVPGGNGYFTVVSATRNGNSLRTANGTVVDLTKPNDYTYTFRYYIEQGSNIGGYRIIPELSSDLSNLLGISRPYYLVVDDFTLRLRIQGSNGAAALRISIFNIER